MADSLDSKVFTIAAGDRFGDLGLVGVLIATRTSQGGAIDSLLMSCRALGRQLETVFVDRCLTALEQEWDVKEWVAEYKATKKNKLVEQFWDSVGFLPVEELADGKLYRLPVSQRLRPSIDYVDISEETKIWKTELSA